MSNLKKKSILLLFVLSMNIWFSSVEFIPGIPKTPSTGGDANQDPLIDAVTSSGEEDGTSVINTIQDSESAGVRTSNIQEGNQNTSSNEILLDNDPLSIKVTAQFDSIRCCGPVQGYAIVLYISSNGGTDVNKREDYTNFNYEVKTGSWSTSFWISSSYTITFQVSYLRKATLGGLIADEWHYRPKTVTVDPTSFHTTTYRDDWDLVTGIKEKVDYFTYSVHVSEWAKISDFKSDKTATPVNSPVVISYNLVNPTSWGDYNSGTATLFEKIGISGTWKPIQTTPFSLAHGTNLPLSFTKLFPTKTPDDTDSFYFVTISSTSTPCTATTDTIRIKVNPKKPYITSLSVKWADAAEYGIINYRESYEVIVNVSNPTGISISDNVILGSKLGTESVVNTNIGITVAAGSSNTISQSCQWNYDNFIIGNNHWFDGGMDTYTVHFSQADLILQAGLQTAGDAGLSVETDVVVPGDKIAAEIVMEECYKNRKAAYDAALWSSAIALGAAVGSLIPGPAGWVCAGVSVAFDVVAIVDIANAEGYETAAAECEGLAKDPYDLNYTECYIVKPLDVSLLNANTTIEHLLNNWTEAIANYTRYVEALNVTENRYYSAYDAGARDCMVLQAEYLTIYSQAVTDNLARLNLISENVVSEVMNTTKLLQSINGYEAFENIIGNVSQLCLDGLSPEMRNNLTTIYGFTPQEIDASVITLRNYTAEEEHYYNTTYPEIQQLVIENSDNLPTITQQLLDSASEQQTIATNPVVSYFIKESRGSAVQAFLNVGLEQTIVEIKPGQVATFNLDITSLVGVPMEYCIALQGLNPTWVGSPSQVVTIGPNAFMEIAIQISVPKSFSEEPGVYEFGISITCTEDATISYMVTGIIVILPFYDAIFECLNPDLTIFDSEIAIFNFRLQNLGNTPEEFSITSNEITLATRDFEITTITLNPAETVEFYLSLDPLGVGTAILTVEASSIHQSLSSIASIVINDDDTTDPVIDISITGYQLNSSSGISITFTVAASDIESDIDLDQVLITVAGLEFTTLGTRVITLQALGNYTITANVANADNDWSGDVERTTTSVNFSLSLTTHYNLIMDEFNSLKAYSLANLCFPTNLIITCTLCLASKGFYLAWMRYQACRLPSAVVKDIFSQVLSDVTQSYVNLLADIDLIDDTDATYLIAHLRTLKNQLALFAGFMVGTEASRQLALGNNVANQLAAYAEDNLSRCAEMSGLKVDFCALAYTLEGIIVLDALHQPLDDAINLTLEAVECLQNKVICLADGDVLSIAQRDWFLAGIAEICGHLQSII